LPWRSEDAVEPGQVHRLRLGAVSRREERLRWLARLRLAAALSAAALGMEIVCIPLVSPRLAVREVQLRGDPRIIEQVSPRIRLPANTNILRAPLDVIQQQVESVPAVRKAYVARDLPHRLVVVVLEPREAMAVIRCGEQALLVDRQGVVFTIRDEWGWGLPEMVGSHLTPGRAGGEQARAEITRLLAVLQVLGPEPRLQVARLELRGDKDIEIVLESGGRVRLGGGDELQAKVKLLAAAIDQLGADHIGYLDLSDPGSAYWRPRAGAMATALR